jgi:epoxyqueuosine reductase
LNTLKQTVTDYALELGFDLVRVTSSEEFTEDREITLQRLEDGLMDGLPWYHRDRVLRGTSPQELLPGARSIICLGLSYYRPVSPSNSQQLLTGKVAQYARLQDYHKVMKARMRDYVQGLSSRLEIPIAARWYVDDGPMLDRAAAARSGLGWFGKNTNILTSSHGSWIFLGQVITDLELEPDPPLKKTCGSCVRCIDACPTGAIVAPYVIDNTLCISYQTIENRGPIPIELRPKMLDWVFGCDICQDVCPVNRSTLAGDSAIWKQEAAEGTPAAKLDTLGLVDLLRLSEEEFRQRFKGTPILRAKRVGLQRNACVALGNLGDPSAVPALSKALAHDSPLVRSHAAWALGQIGTAEARVALDDTRSKENDDEVLEEIHAALANNTVSAIDDD